MNSPRRSSSALVASPASTRFSPYPSTPRTPRVTMDVEADLCYTPRASLSFEMATPSSPSWITPVLPFSPARDVSLLGDVTPTEVDSPFTPPPFTNIQIESVLGEGSTATVSKAIADGKVIAVKKILAQNKAQKKRFGKHKKTFSPSGEKEISDLDDVLAQLAVLEQKNPFAVEYHGATISSDDRYSEITIYMACAEPVTGSPAVAKEFLKMAMDVSQDGVVLNDPKADNLGSVDGKLCFLDFEIKPLADANISCELTVYPTQEMSKTEKKLFKYLCAIWLTYHQLNSQDFNLREMKEKISKYTLEQIQSELDDFLQ